MSAYKAQPSNRRAFHNLMEQGKSPAEIAEIYGVSEMAVVLTLRHPRPKIKGVNYTHLELPIPEKELEEAYKEGSLEAFSEEYGVSVTLLKGRLIRAGVIEPKPKPEPEAEPEAEPEPKPEPDARGRRLPRAEKQHDARRIKKLYAKGLSLNQVAEEIGKSAFYVRQVLIELGVPRRKRGSSTRAVSSKPEAKKAEFLEALLDMAIEGKLSLETAKEVYEKYTQIG